MYMYVKHPFYFFFQYFPDQKAREREKQADTVELQWLEHLLDYENMFEIGVVRAGEC